MAILIRLESLPGPNAIATTAALMWIVMGALLWCLRTLYRRWVES